MRFKDRVRLVLGYLERHGSASYNDLAELLNVSTMTVRRDCDELASTGKIIKTVGGVQQAHAPLYLYENGIWERMSANRAEKRAIAQQALELLGNNQAIFVDGGTTCLELAKLIAEECSGLTIVTNSAMACLEMGNDRNTVIGIGGEYDPATLSFVGPQAEAFARTVFVDLAFFSTKGFLPLDGTYESAVATFRIKQILADQAVCTALLVDHTKFGRRALSKVLDISQIQYVVTDDQAPAVDMSYLGDANIQVIRASTGKTEGRPHATKADS